MTMRWWLSRGHGLIFLHVAEVGGRERGYRVSVSDRHAAREYLPILRAHLAGAIERQDRPVRTFTAAEVAGEGRLNSIFDPSRLTNDGPG